MKCVLHIGTEKTATTFLQDWLYDNEDALSAQGVALTRSADHPVNRKLVSNVQNGFDDYTRMHGLHSEEDRQAFFSGFEEELSAEIWQKANDHHTVLFTSEHFHSRLGSVKQLQKLKTFLDQFFEEIRVVCYFREQSSLRTSLYSTGLRVSTDQPITEFFSQATTKSHYFNYLLFFSKWEEVFSKEALVPRLFLPDHLLEGDIRLDFLASALPDVDPSALNYATERANEALSADEALLFQKINAARPQFIGKLRDPTGPMVRSLVARRDFIDHNTKIADPRQEAMYEEFNDVNIEFHERYFGEARNPFPRPDPVTIEEEKGSSLRVADVADLLEKILSMNGFLYVGKEEVDSLAILANRLLREKAISNEDAIMLLGLANRARPKGEGIKARIEDLLDLR
jgi:hypothetical protein